MSLVLTFFLTAVLTHHVKSQTTGENSNSFELKMQQQGKTELTGKPNSPT